MTNKNKIGIALFVCGALMTVGFRLTYPTVGFVGAILVLVGLYIALKGRKGSKVSDYSTWHTNADLDDDH